jgi:SAM-dependent methyltransferase
LILAIYRFIDKLERHRMSTAPNLYDNRFYDAQMAGSYKSACVYAEILYRYYAPASIADLGCGRGTWLKAFKEFGADNLVGFDGAWNTQENMVDADITFVSCDLNVPLKLAEEDTKFDLALSLEVAEHLLPSSARNFVSSLVSLSDVVLFSAAFKGQGGRNHINEQPPTYWAALFSEHGYVPFDLFRASVWGRADVEIWYQQNAFLYVNKAAAAFETLVLKGASPISNIAFMDCVHPELYYRKLGT